MTRNEVLRLAREAGIPDDNIPSLARGRLETGAQLLERFAALVAAAERINHQSEIQRLTALANTAEKWRGIAMARDGDGRTVQQVQAEARAAERDACLEDVRTVGGQYSVECEALMRKRWGSHA